MRVIIVSLACVVLLSGCVNLNEIFTTGAEIRGDVEKGFYVAPDGRFRIKIPQTSAGKFTVQESYPAAGVLEVILEDGLCRRFIVAEQVDIHKGLTLDEWVDQRLIGGLEREGLKVREHKSVQTSHGPAVFYRYTSPRGAPCRSVVVRNGKEKEILMDADVGVYVFRGNGFIYQHIYALGMDPAKGDLSMPPRGPLEEQLARFSDGVALSATPIARPTLSAP
ncbi:MAG: hypothetical protein OEV28_05440 [Nitrospirota bacterium]|nr:hypothetical protein [Nitrospirota bacterium]